MMRLLYGCTRSNPKRPVGFLPLVAFLLLFAPMSHAEKVDILVISIHGEHMGQSDWQPTVDFLQASLPQHEFNLIALPPNRLGHIRKLVAQGEVEFIITQPAIYVDLELAFGVSRILTMVKNGGYAEFGSTIITRSDSGITTLSDLHGKTIGGVAELGFGGWLIGYKEMLEHGFDPFTDGKEVKFLGTQLNEIRAVLEGEIDAAVIRTGVLERFDADGTIAMADFFVLGAKKHPGFPFKVSTGLYPEWAFAKTRNVSNALSKSVALALLSLEGNDPISRKAGFQEWTFPYDYQPVHDLLRTLQVGPYKEYGKVSIYDFIAQHIVLALVLLIMVLIILSMAARIYRSNISLSREKIEKEKTLEEMAFVAGHDPLTGLTNRTLFLDLLEKVVLDAIRRDSFMALMFIDLDGFKAINDRYGHNYGDEVLRNVAQVLQETLRANDVIARLGGDEFIAALSDVQDRESVSILARRIVENISQISLPNGFGITFGASIGVVFGLPGKCDVDELLHQSDQLMYEAKRKGKGRFAIAAFPDSPGNPGHRPSAI